MPPGPIEHTGGALYRDLALALRKGIGMSFVRPNPTSARHLLTPVILIPLPTTSEQEH